VQAMNTWWKVGSKLSMLQKRRSTVDIGLFTSMVSVVLEFMYSGFGRCSVCVPHSYSCE